MKTLAVIGGNGMLGSDLVRYLTPYFSVTPISKDNYSKCTHKKFDVVINANGNSKRFWANNNILGDFTLSTASVYKSIFDFKYSVYVYISSSDVYENHSDNKDTNEDKQINTTNLSPYGFHKYISELIIKKYVKNHLILRCSMILGRNLKKGPIYDILKNKSLYITKNSYLQMITTEEIASIISFLIKQRRYSDILNVGGVGSFSFRDIHKYIDIPAIFLKNAEKQVYEMNITKLQKLYPLKTSNEYLQEFLTNLHHLSNRDQVYDK